MFGPPLPHSGPAEMAATSGIRCYPRPGEPQSEGGGSGNAKRRGPWGCGVGVGSIASSARRPLWPAPPLGPPLPRSGPAETAATSNIRCGWHPGGLHSTPSQGRNVNFVGGSGGVVTENIFTVCSKCGRFEAGSGPGAAAGAFCPVGAPVSELALDREHYIPSTERVAPQGVRTNCALNRENI